MKRIQKLHGVRYHVAYAAAVVLLYGFAEWRSLTFDGKQRPPLSAADLRQTSPGSWTYTYWSQDHHGK